jgi:hypothetical protein
MLACLTVSKRLRAPLANVSPRRLPERGFPVFAVSILAASRCRSAATESIVSRKHDGQGLISFFVVSS